MQKINITYASPSELRENPWNPNEMDSINEEKLMNSVDEFGLFKPILCRELEDGTLQILGGQHRNRAAILKGYDEVPVINLGVMSDERAKKIGLVDNGRYGEDDLEKLAAVFAEIGSPDDIINILPIGMEDFENIFGKHGEETNFDDLIPDDDDEAAINAAVAELETGMTLKTHQIMRFKIPVEDATAIQAFINRVQREQGFTDSDSLTNAGDTLTYLLGSHPDFKDEE